MHGYLGGIDNLSGQLSWYDALKWVAALKDGKCGLNDGSFVGDWRLPTKTEWMAMVAYARNRFVPSLTDAAGTAKWTTNGDAFNNVGINFYWASTTSDAFDPGSAWSVDFANGGVFTNPRAAGLYVWPVRGGQSGEFGNVIIQ